MTFAAKIAHGARPWIVGAISVAGILGCAGSISYSLTRPIPNLVPPEDAGLQRERELLRGATPQAASNLESRLAVERALLPAAAGFDAWLARECGDWTVLASATDRYPGLEVRRYALACNHPTLRSWPGILQTTRVLCTRPGLSVDSLSLAAAPDGSDAFVQAQITLTARLRP
jgi:hypothetical protein